jgi:predicted enzyme related to lactoylglutathione lyase
MKLQQLRLVTDDVPALARFYQQVTGVAGSGNEGYLEFNLSVSNLAIASQKALERYGAGATVPRSNRSTSLDFEVEDVDRERERLAAIIGEFVMEPAVQPWGVRAMLFRDPDGNLINFFAPVGD